MLVVSFVRLLQGAPHREMPANDANDACRIFRLGAAGCSSSRDGWPVMLMMRVVSLVWVLQGAPHSEMAGQ